MFHLFTAPRRLAVAAAAIVCLAGPAFAQGSKLRLDGLEKLEAKAAKTVDVTIDRDMMTMASKILAKNNDPESKKIHDIVAGIEEIYVRSYEFENLDEYQPADVDAIRTQLNAPGWNRIAGVRSRKVGENAEVWVMSQAGKIQGLAILVVEPKEVTVVNIVGSIDPEQLSELDGSFGIPRVELKRTIKTTP